MSKLKDPKVIIIIVVLLIMIISIIIGISKTDNKKIKDVDPEKGYVVNGDVDFDIKDTHQYTFRKLRFNLPNEFKGKRVSNNVEKYTINTKDEKATLIVTSQITEDDAKTFATKEFGIKKSDKFKKVKINKAVWLKVKKKNTYIYTIKQRGLVYGIRYDYSKSKKIAKKVPKILEETMYFRIYSKDKKKAK